MQGSGRQAAVAGVAIVEPEPNLHDAEAAMHALFRLQWQAQKLAGRLRQPSPTVAHGNIEPQRLYQMWGKSQQSAPLIQRFLDEGKLAELQVAETAMNEARRICSRAKR